MSENWMPGDLAQRLSPAEIRSNLPAGYSGDNGGGTPAAFRVGGLYLVDGVVDWGVAEAGLIFAGKRSTHRPSGGSWSSLGFRKINPLSDEERRQALEDLKLPGMADA